MLTAVKREVAKADRARIKGFFKGTAGTLAAQPRLDWVKLSPRTLPTWKPLCTGGTCLLGSFLRALVG